MSKLGHTLLAVAALLLPTAGQAETKEEWIALGARVHGGFGPFIPVGIRIGLDAMQRLKADRHDVTVLYYDGGLPPCPCVADGIMIATQATPGQKTLVMSPEKAPPEIHGCHHRQEPQNRRSGAIHHRQGLASENPRVAYRS